MFKSHREVERLLELEQRDVVLGGCAVVVLVQDDLLQLKVLPEIKVDQNAEF